MHKENKRSRILKKIIYKESFKTNWSIILKQMKLKIKNPKNKEIKNHKPKNNKD